MKNLETPGKTGRVGRSGVGVGGAHQEISIKPYMFFN